MTDRANLQRKTSNITYVNTQKGDTEILVYGFFDEKK